MRTDRQTNLRAWLTAEEAGRPEEADGLFRAIARLLPRVGPPDRFADRVLARIAPAPKADDIWAAWWLRAAIATTLVTAGVAAGSWPVRTTFRAVLASLHLAIWGVDQVGTGLQAWVGSALTAWAGLAQAAVVLGRLLVAPGPAMLLTLNLAVAGAAFAALQRLLAQEE